MSSLNEERVRLAEQQTRSLLKVIYGSELLGGTQLCHGLSGAMEGAVFTFQRITDDFPLFSGLLFINGAGSDRNPGQRHGKKVFLPFRGWALLKSSWKDQEGIPASQKF